MIFSGYSVEVQNNHSETLHPIISDLIDNVGSDSSFEFGFNPGSIVKIQSIIEDLPYF